MHRPIVGWQIGFGFHDLNSRQGSHFLLSENARDYTTILITGARGEGKEKPHIATGRGKVLI